MDNALPAFLTERKIAQIPLFQWLFVLVGMPAIYLLTGLLDSLISPLADRMWQRLRGQPALKHVHVVPNTSSSVTAHFGHPVDDRKS